MSPPMTVSTDFVSEDRHENAIRRLNLSDGDEAKSVALCERRYGTPAFVKADAYQMAHFAAAQLSKSNVHVSAVRHVFSPIDGLAAGFPEK